MKKIWQIIMIIGVVVLSCSAEIYWKNDYIWRPKPNGYATETMGFGNVSTGDLSFVDYNLEMDIEFKKFSEWGNLRVMVRQNGIFDSYSLNIDKNGLSLWRYDGRWDMGQMLSGYSIPIKENQKYHLDLTVKDDEIEVNWDGKPVINAKDRMNKYPYGGALLRTEMALTEVTNLSLTLNKTIDIDEATKMMWQKTQEIYPLPEKPKPFKTAQEVGFNNMMLIYTGHYGDGRGNWLFVDALPYVGYLDSDLSVVDSFFDAFLFLGIQAPSGRFFDAVRGGDPSTAGNSEDWLWYLDKLFEDNMQLAAFDRAKGRVNEVLGDAQKAQVVIMIPNPLTAQANFGEIDGKMLSFSTENQSVKEAQKQRFTAIDWYVREIEKRWQEKEFENLELLGFYWMSEDIFHAHDEEIVRLTADYLHEKDYRFYWIPFNKAPGYDGEYGFDCVFLQPNYMFSEQVGLSRFWQTYVDAVTYGTNFEIEGESTVLTSKKARERYLNYLKAGVTLGYRDSAKAYYFGSKALVSCALASDAELRDIYDKTYLFAKGIFDEGLW
ncbi:MAG TPA: DUF4855 domain-containing protein [Firmicutes bacterium]|nr:DUF4855 domain-containing protein [Bacillota bacterium]